MALLHSIGKESWGHFFTRFTHVQDSTERIDLSEPDPQWKMSGKMHHPRIHANSVLLPDGKVLVVGGMSSYEHISDMNGMDGSVLPAEMYDPSTDTWTMMAAQQTARLYHSTAILLPDGRVVSMGSNPRS